MDMTFGEALNVWSRVVSDDKTLTINEVKAASQWTKNFIDQLKE